MSTTRVATRSFGAVWMACDGKDGEVAEVAEQVESDDDAGAKAEGERQVAAGVADFAGDEGDVVPGVGGEERAGLRDAECDEEAECGGGVEGVDERHVLRAPCMGEVGVEDRGIAQEGEGCESEEQDDAGELSGRVKTFWITLPQVTPRVLMKQMSRMMARATAWAVESESA